MHECSVATIGRSLEISAKNRIRLRNRQVPRCISVKKMCVKYVATRCAQRIIVETESKKKRCIKQQMHDELPPMLYKGERGERDRAKKENKNKPMKKNAPLVTAWVSFLLLLPC